MGEQSIIDHRRGLAHLAADLALEAGRLVRAGRSEGVGDVATKSSPTDVVTEFDRAAENLIVAGISSARPTDGLVGEEGASRVGTSGIDWLIDPIDGTTNFLYDLPGYGVSIAAVDDAGPLAGAVYVPSTDDLFVAWRGGGATRNGRAISCSGGTRLDLAMVATGFSYHVANRADQAQVVAALLPQIRDIRRLGAAAPDLCNVACGRVDAYYEQWLNPWDVAAGIVIATEAGARVGHYPGRPGEPDGLLVATPDVYQPLTRLINEAISALAPRSVADMPDGWGIMGAWEPES